ncbi:uncharacterized protein DDB_G0290301 isoform X2 [Vigna unguiculata]|uniref:uncharacterized protein DDB_G0290301 isoform X2 n=1 Tax=Vigna unguiculata TaxID=3917 RepID=UPI001016E02D|nr:uncharacterized protein DDB_G0290301 isoform X2 [Vigna unguiculata]
MSLPDSPVPDNIETDPSEDEEEVEEEIEEEEAEEEVEEEEIEEEVEEEDVEEEVEEEEVEEVYEEEVEEEEVEEVEEEEEVEEMELEEEEEEEQEVEEVEVEEEEIEGEEVEEEEEEVEVEVEEEEEEEEEEGEQEVEEGEEEVQEEEGEEEKQEQAVENKKEEQQQQQREAVEEKKEEHPQQQEKVTKEKKEEQRQQPEEAVEEKKKEQEQQQEEAVEEKKKEQQLQQEAMKEKEGQQKGVEAVGEDRLALTGSPPDADEGPKDLSVHMESKEQDKNLGPDYSVAENPEVIPPSSVHCMEENDAMLKISVPSCEILTSKKEELHLKYDISSHSKSTENLTNVENCRSQGLEVDGENAGSLLQKETQDGYSELGCNSKASLCHDNDINSRVRDTKSSSVTGQDMVIGLLPKDCIVEDASGDQNSRNNIKQLEMESRDDMKQTLSRTRSMSPSAEIKNRNKRPKIICDFFAKGWCIRGSSCSFLHTIDTVDKTDQEAEADLVTTHQKRKLKVEEGVRENVQRIRMNEQEQTPSWHPSQEKQNFTPRDNLFPENRFAFSSTSNCFNPKQDGMATLRNQHMYKGYASTLLSHSPNSSLVTQFPASSMSLSQRISSQSACSLPFSSSLGAGNLNAQTLTSKSTFSGSGREDFPLVSSSSVPSYPTGYKSKICSYDWEPSVPFRPSFFITPMNVSSPADLYDPLRDSIEIPNIGDGSLKASLLIQGSNVLASSQAPIYGDSAGIGKYTSSVNDDKSSVSSHNKFYENEPNKNSVPHEKDYLPNETEITSGTYSNYQNGKIGTGQNTFDVADSTKKEREMTEHDARRHGEGSGHKTKRGDRDKKNHEIDVDFQMDGSMQKEPKALKMLRAALVDHVKELLKPVWHEGRLSKDAHIMIVRKSVDKVVSTIEPHQIPTIDTAKQYVSSSRAKIAKLVNGYVNKYGKS